VSIRYQLEPLDRETVGAYVAHRLTIAGSSAAVTFAPQALDLLHRLSGGIPRLINLICDRALLAAFSVRENRVTADMVAHAAESLDVRSASPPRLPHYGAAGAAAVALLASAFAVGSSAYLYQHFFDPTVEAASPSANRAPSRPAVTARRQLPPGALQTILVGSYPLADVNVEANVRAITEWLEMSGYAVYYVGVDLGSKGRWYRVLAGAYTDPQLAEREASRLNAVVPGARARVINAAGAGAPE
jgi:general secretion pathway protein A